MLARRKYLASANSGLDLEAIMEEYRYAVNVRRIMLKPLFQDFDRTKNGHVTKQQFLRVVDSLRITAPDEITQQLLRRYMDMGNVDEVNYVDFCEDIDSSKELFGVGRDFNHSYDYFPKTRPRVSQAEIVRNTPQDVEDVMARLRQVCGQNRIRIGEFFRDFDKLRTGFITNAQFRIGLSMAKLPISNPEFQLLASTFSAGERKAGEHVCWREFVDSVDCVFTKKGLEKNVDIVLGDAATATQYGRENASDDEKRCVDDIIGRFQEIVRRHRLDAKSFFQDHDYHKHFKVTPKIFRQVMFTHGFQMNEHEVACITKVYGCGETNQPVQIRYNDFLKDCNVLKFEIYGPYTGAKSTYNAKFIDYSGDKEDMIALMKKVKNMVKRERIRLSEFFQDHDQLRKGVIEPTKFRSVLHS